MFWSLRDQQYGSRWSQRASLLVVCVWLVSLISGCAAGLFSDSGSWGTSTLRQSLRTLAVDPKDGQRLYAGSVDGQIFISKDNGETWSDASKGLVNVGSINRLTFDVAGRVLLAGTDRGLYWSSNQAGDWQKVLSLALPVDRYTAITFDYNDQQTFYIGTARKGVYSTHDGGKSWQPVRSDTSSKEINDLVYDSNGKQLWITTPTGVYRSSRGSEAWEPIRAGLPENLIIYTTIPASVFGGERNRVFLGSNRGFFFSTNGGGNWNQGKEALVGTSIRQILIDVRTPTTLYIATDTGAFRSDDSGLNWRGIAPGLPRSQRVYALAISSGDASRLFAASNTLYRYPGGDGSFAFSRVIYWIVIISLFVVLLRFATRRRNQS